MLLGYLPGYCACRLAIVHVAWLLLCMLLDYWPGYCASCLATGQAIVHVAWLAHCACCLATGQAIMHVS